MKINKYVFMILAMPVWAYAHDLTIVNQTSRLLSFKVDHVCSSEFGVIDKHQTKTIAEKVLYNLCSDFKWGCIIASFEGSNCEGRFLGGMMYINEREVKFSSVDGINIFATENKLYFTEL